MADEPPLLQQQLRRRRLQPTAWDPLSPRRYRALIAGGAAGMSHGRRARGSSWAWSLKLHITVAFTSASAQLASYCSNSAGRPANTAKTGGRARLRSYLAIQHESNEELLATCSLELYYSY